MSSDSSCTTTVQKEQDVQTATDAPVPQQATGAGDVAEQKEPYSITKIGPLAQAMKPKAKSKSKSKPARAATSTATSAACRPLDLLSTLPPSLVESILLQTCLHSDGGSTEAIGNFAATCTTNALTVAESRPLWKAVLTHRFTTEFAERVLQKHDDINHAEHAPTADVQPAAKKSKPAAAKTKPAPTSKNAAGELRAGGAAPQEGSLSSIRSCVFFCAKTHKIKPMPDGEKPAPAAKQSSAAVCEFCLSAAGSLGVISKQVKQAKNIVCCNACCKIHVVNTTDAIDKCELAIAPFSMILCGFSKQWMHRHECRRSNQGHPGQAHAGRYQAGDALIFKEELHRECTHPSPHRTAGLATKLFMQWYGKTSKLYMRTAAKKAALGRFKGDSDKLQAAIAKKKPKVRLRLISGITIILACTLMAGN